MANGKMDPLSAILSELRQHCEQSGTFWKAMAAIGQSSTPKQTLKQLLTDCLQDGWASENLKIAALCDLLRITDIPDKETSKVISELETLSNSHGAVTVLLRDLKKP